MIAGTMPSLLEQIDGARSDEKLRADAAENIRRILSGEEGDFAARVIGELSQTNEWEELNDRFYKTLAFGTGVLRGRTIRKIVTPSELGTPTALGRPEFPCVGTQMGEPHASGIIEEVNKIGGTSSVPSQKSRDHTKVVPAKGEIITAGDEIDRAYMERLETLILNRKLIRRAHDLKIVYTAIHGTGGVIVKPMLRKIGLHFSFVPEQDQFDGRFPTVKSPNPENAEALNLGISLAQKEK